MPFPVLGSNSAVAGFSIDNSLRFNQEDDAYLQRIPSSASNNKTFTLSTWIKFCNFVDTSGSQNIFESRPSDYFLIVLTNINNASGGNTIRCEATGGMNLGIDRFFRDGSAWYHLVFAFDTTQATASNRVKFYVNGEQTGLNSTYTTYPNQNDTFTWNTTNRMNVGGSAFSADENSDFYLADTYNIDGQQLAPTEFGETNDNGVWIPKRFSGSYGTNGFKLEYKNSGALGTDTSGNGNDFTATNLTATDQTTDTPTNNFCTFNPLDNDTVTGAATFSEGNLSINANSDAQSGCPSTIAVSNGAWYIEGKCLSSTFEIGVFGYGDGFSFNLANHPPYGDNGYPFAYEYGGNLKVNNSNVQTGLATYTTNDILAIALDMDNNTIKFFKNGSQVGTTITDSNLSTFAPYTFYVATHTGSNTNMFSLNTGNPAYTISSGNSDANGYGNFEYAVPSGYYALCTKNLAEYG